MNPLAKYLDTSKELGPIAYSYLRFSMLIQGQGDSVKRQSTGAEKWEERTGVPIISSMSDLGLSAYSNEHVEKGELGVFLEMCNSPAMKAKTASRDVFLVVESLDRLSRRKIMEAVTQLQGIVEAGVKVVTLQDGMVYDDDAMNSLQGLIISITIMSRANEESKTKAKRVAAGWQGKRDKIKERIAQGKGGLITSRIPFCYKIKADGFTLEVIPEAVKICRKVFRMVAEGETYSGTAKKLNHENVPTAGSFCTWKSAKRGIAWTGAGVKRIIQSHWPIGNFVSGKTGDEVKGYFPAVVEEELWAKARKLASKNKSWGNGRGLGGGQRGYNIFTNIARDAETGEGMQCRDTGHSKHLLPASVRFGKRDGTSWNLAHFEDLFFSTIRLALDVETNKDKEELELAKTHEEIQKADDKLARFTDLIAEDASLEVPEILKRMKELRESKTALVEKAQAIKEEIMDGSALTLDPDKTDRDTLRMAVRSVVKQIRMNNDEKWFSVTLHNGIQYKVTHHQDGLVQVESDDMQTKEMMALHSRGGKKGWEKARDLSVTG